MAVETTNKAFPYVDANHDGTLSVQELWSALKKFKPEFNPTEEEKKWIMEQWDTVEGEKGSGLDKKEWNAFVNKVNERFHWC